MRKRKYDFTIIYDNVDVSRWARSVFNIFHSKPKTTIPWYVNVKKDFEGMSLNQKTFLSLLDEKINMEQIGRMNVVPDTSSTSRRGTYGVKERMYEQ